MNDNINRNETMVLEIAELNSLINEMEVGNMR